MGNPVTTGTPGELVTDPTLFDVGDWNVGTFWTMTGNGLARFDAPGNAGSLCKQTFTPVISHLYKCEFTIDAIFMEGIHGFNAYIADDYLPIVDVPGDYIQYHQVNAILANFFSFSTAFFPAPLGNFIELTYFSVTDIIATILQGYGLNPQKYTMYEYWLLEDDKVMLTFANLNGAMNITLIYDPAEV